MKAGTALIFNGCPSFDGRCDMGRSSKKPRQKKLDPRRIVTGSEASEKKERDWTFEDIVRSKTRRR